jgi:Na+-transporting NADH:ubiquinone oxidoreductase subunit NqrC
MTTPQRRSTIAALVAFVCAVLVSTASVLLDPIQQEQIDAEQAARMEAMLDTLPGMREVMEEAGVTALETRIVDLSTGAFAPEIDPASFDMIAAANDPAAINRTHNGRRSSQHPPSSKPMRRCICWSATVTCC